MRRHLFVAMLSMGMLASAAPSLAAPCKDAKGKFTKCPPAAPVKATRCKAANGKFAKCGTPQGGQWQIREVRNAGSEACLTLGAGAGDRYMPSPFGVRSSGQRGLSTSIIFVIFFRLPFIERVAGPAGITIVLMLGRQVRLVGLGGRLD